MRFKLVSIFQDARNAQIIHICIHINQKLKAIVLRNVAHISIISFSFGTKNQINCLANRNTIIHMKLKNKKLINILTFIIFSALSTFFAPIFCHTRIELAIDIPIDNIITN